MDRIFMAKLSQTKNLDKDEWYVLRYDKEKESLDAIPFTTWQELQETAQTILESMDIPG